MVGGWERGVQPAGGRARRARGGGRAAPVSVARHSTVDSLSSPASAGAGSIPATEEVGSERVARWWRQILTVLSAPAVAKRLTQVGSKSTPNMGSFGMPPAALLDCAAVSAMVSLPCQTICTVWAVGIVSVRHRRAGEGRMPCGDGGMECFEFVVFHPLFWTCAHMRIHGTSSCVTIAKETASAPMRMHASL